MTQRVVVSECFGGFGLSDVGLKALKDKGWEPAGQYDSGMDIARDDPRLLAVVDELGGAAVGHNLAHLVVVEVPDGVKWHVHEYDGYETLHEDHRSWGSDGQFDNC